jgi:MATE family multidrug resistance protein
MSSTAETPQHHPFLQRPHMTMLTLSLPVLFSMIAEPLTGLVDTAFVARLGSEPLAAMGVGTVALSSIFWIFNFLQIGTQTDVARRLGAGKPQEAAAAAGLALLVSTAIGIVLALITLPAAPWLAAAMGAAGAVADAAVSYIHWRALGAPAILITFAAFGALRGAQQMRAPLFIAVGVNLLNVVLDALLIFGAGPLPALGVGGAALATSISQWIGAGWAVAAVLRHVGRPTVLPPWRAALQLLQVGGDLFVRTGLLTLFLLVTTRTVTQIGADAGAAHQAIRQVWLLTALFLDAFAVTGQSLIGYFLGAGAIAAARRVAAVVSGWSLAVGLALTLLMLLGRDLVLLLLVPQAAGADFGAAWWIAALAQPLNALAFAGDGIHWGTGDFRYLRNGMIIATGSALLLLPLLLLLPFNPLTMIWACTAVWITVRALIGVLRVWPGIGNAPLKAQP